MHAISSYCGNRPTNTQTYKFTHRQDRLQYTAPQVARSVIKDLDLKHSGLGVVLDLAVARVDTSLDFNVTILRCYSMCLSCEIPLASWLLKFVLLT